MLLVTTIQLLELPSPLIFFFKWVTSTVSFKLFRYPLSGNSQLEDLVTYHKFRFVSELFVILKYSTKPVLMPTEYHSNANRLQQGNYQGNNPWPTKTDIYQI